MITRLDVMTYLALGVIIKFECILLELTDAMPTGSVALLE